MRCSTYFLLSSYSSFLDLIILYRSSFSFLICSISSFYLSLSNQIYLVSYCCFCWRRTANQSLSQSFGFSPYLDFISYLIYFYNCSLSYFFFSSSKSFYFYFLYLSMVYYFYLLSFCYLYNSYLYFISFYKDYLLIFSNSLNSFYFANLTCNCSYKSRCLLSLYSYSFSFF